MRAALYLSVVRSTACVMCCQDLSESGSTLAEILRAGQWKSVAFMRYLNSADIEKGAVLEVACDTDDEQWID